MGVRNQLCFLWLPILLLGWAGQSAQQSPAKPAQGQASASPAAPAATSAASLSPDRARFEYGGNAVEIPATFVQDLIFLPVTVNRSRPSLFALDTGSDVTSIDPAVAKEIGVTANQRVAVILPGMMLPFDSLPPVARNDFAADAGRSYEGTIGADFFSRVVVEIDYARQTVRAFDPNSYKYAGHGRIFPLTLWNGMPLVRAKMVTPRGKQVEADFGVDTGLVAGIVVSGKFSDAHKVFPTKGKPAQAYDPQLIGGESVSVYRLRSFDLGHWVASETIAELSRSKLAGTDNPRLAGVIGAGLLRRFTVVLDYPHHQVIFEPNTHFKDYDEEDKSGIALVAKGSNLRTFEVVHVVPGTPAAAAGIQAGDIIAGVNDEPAADITLGSLRDMFCQVGHTYKIVIERGNQTKNVTVQMRRLLT